MLDYAVFNADIIILRFIVENYSIYISNLLDFDEYEIIDPRKKIIQNEILLVCHILYA